MNKRVAFRCSIVIVVLMVSVTWGAGAQTCACDNTSSSICSEQGFQITLSGFSIDQNAGTSSWTYTVCNSPESGCVPPKDLSHLDIVLPGLGSCLTAQQVMGVQQVSSTGGDGVVLVCGVSEKDPSCDLFGTQGTDFVAKCDVAQDSNLDPGECASFRLTLAGEMPTLGAGAATTVTKAGPGCAGDCILGPSCTACQTTEDRCLTRTAGFWGTHPAITGLFLPVTVCDKALSTTAAGGCLSVTEALCVAPGNESKGNPSYAQLVRQLAAAKLNLAATAANQGLCDGAAARIAACEALCGANDATIAASGCIEALAGFNESQDTFPSTPSPFVSPGPASPRECQKANGNGVVIGKKGCA